jgi:hypothetical protein
MTGMRWRLLLVIHFFVFIYFVFIFLLLCNIFLSNYLLVFTIEPRSVEMTGMRWSLLLFNSLIICFYLFIYDLFICGYHGARVRGDDWDAGHDRLAGDVGVHGDRAETLRKGFRRRPAVHPQVIEHRQSQSNCRV